MEGKRRLAARNRVAKEARPAASSCMFHLQSWQVSWIISATSVKYCRDQGSSELPAGDQIIRSRAILTSPPISRVVP